jgi:hypothetical protein
MSNHYIDREIYSDEWSWHKTTEEGKIYNNANENYFRGMQMLGLITDLNDKKKRDGMLSLEDQTKLESLQTYSNNLFTTGIELINKGLGMENAHNSTHQFYNLLGSIYYAQHDYPNAEVNFQKGLETYLSGPGSHVSIDRNKNDWRSHFWYYGRHTENSYDKTWSYTPIYKDGEETDFVRVNLRNVPGFLGAFVYPKKLREYNNQYKKNNKKESKDDRLHKNDYDGIPINVHDFTISNYYKNLARAQSGQIITYPHSDQEKFPGVNVTDDYNGKYRAALENYKQSMIIVPTNSGNLNSSFFFSDLKYGTICPICETEEIENRKKEKENRNKQMNVDGNESTELSDKDEDFLNKFLNDDKVKKTTEEIKREEFQKRLDNAKSDKERDQIIKEALKYLQDLEQLTFPKIIHEDDQGNENIKDW